ncbi:16S rRNA (adenine(1518)-N(6)/adenine(1519)-N(6))-dimethyltransferase [Moraxella caviae]|uniref:Ribosomal RNA small subunit methyltransferase A n=1 Tax=Moraxella caviae TaxID=34060 RepID=A0A1T0A8L6_9GAMM|nr:16S rRNA (adenine(1518)-N(6)/adenine(1519)-N(6))-dimethyltransferase RsmA [Moraxella caviae]OOR92076.1 16S rRNA (adenine(1518)-N(6)/adenine(1519)-N(6))-dimethyltransferase [Moraxella caviae]STZ14428.1 Ribosomal RNA small subunit methyltransferase A [Moraxella caviae]VEW10485.1 Ribosomal RNA small subunit methyltransferase A [Moraxella caviae]
MHIPKRPQHIPKRPQDVKHAPRKRFGQNFLHDTSVIRQIVDGIRLNRTDNLLEIGPGLGALTEPLLAEVDGMTVIELDRDLASQLKINIGANSHPDFTIINDNAMHIDYRALAEQVGKGAFRVVGNLPYNISTPILFRLLEFSDVITDMHFMLQKEVVDRITAAPATKEYGRLSVIMQYFCETDYLLTVPNGAFNPPPKVTSAVFRLTPFVNKPICAKDEAVFALVVREAFNHRRKTLRAIFKSVALLPTLDDDAFLQIGIDPQARPETLGVADFVRLADLAAAHKASA